MTDKTKNIVKWSGVGAVALGCVAIYFGGGSETYAMEIVGSVFAIVGIVLAVIKK